MDVRLLVKVNIKVLDLIYNYRVGSLRWNPVTGKVYEVQSKWHKFLWLFHVSTFTLFEIAIAVKFLIDKIYEPFEMTRLLDVYRLVICVVFLMTSMFHWHGVIWRKEIVQLINGVHLYYTTFAETTFFYPPKRNLAAITTAVQVILLLVLASGAVLIFIECPLHYAAQLLPICRPPKMTHYSTPWVLAMSVLYLTIGIYCVSSVFIATAITSALGIFGLNVLTEIGAIKGSQYYEQEQHRVEKWKWWSKHYKCWQILTTEYNSCIGPLIPCVFSFLIGVHILLLYGLIVSKALPAHKIMSIVMQAVIVGYYYFLPYKLYVHSKAANGIKESEKQNCNSKHSVKFYKSLKPIKWAISNLGYIGSLTLVTMLETVGVNTINLILMSVS